MARWYERGTKARRTKRGANRGIFRKRSYVEKSLKGSLPEIINYINLNAKLIIKRSLEKYSNRLSKNIAKKYA